MQSNYLRYFQPIAAIPNYLKRKAQATAVTNRNIIEEKDIFYLSNNKVTSLTKCRCEITTNYFRKRLGQSLSLLKDGAEVFRTWILVGYGSCTKFAKRRLKKENLVIRVFHKILVTNKELE